MEPSYLLSLKPHMLAGSPPTLIADRSLGWGARQTVGEAGGALASPLSGHHAVGGRGPGYLSRIVARAAPWASTSPLGYGLVRVIVAVRVIRAHLGVGRSWMRLG